MSTEIGRAVRTGTLDFNNRETQVYKPSVTRLEPGQTVTDCLGVTYRPVVEEGQSVVRRTRPGDLFLAQSARVRVVACHSAHFRGLLRQIVEVVR